MTDKKTKRFEHFSEKCRECGGHGTITRYYGGGQFISTIDCDRCLGRGAIGNCTRCKGTGLIQEEAGGNTHAPGSGTECPDCRGAGAIGNCTQCGGTGTVMVDIAGTQTPTDDIECPECDGFGFQNSSPD